MLEGLVPNCGITVQHSDRRGREVLLPPLQGKQAVRNLREQSFQVQGPKLYNSLPKKIRSMTKVPVETFKEHLDNYLQMLPDEPNVGGLTPSACNLYSAAPYNSILDQGKTSKRRPGN